MTPTEQLSQWMLQNGFATGHGDTLQDLLGELSWQIDEIRANRANRANRVADFRCVHVAAAISPTNRLGYVWQVIDAGDHTILQDRMSSATACRQWIEHNGYLLAGAKELDQ